MRLVWSPEAIRVEQNLKNQSEDQCRANHPDKLHDLLSSRACTDQGARLEVLKVVATYRRRCADGEGET